MTASVELRSLRKNFGMLAAVSDVSMRIEQGELVTFLGPSGCGKTTLLNLIGGFLDPDAGEILIGGKDIRHLPPHERDLGIVFQSYALFPHMTVADNVAFGLKMRKVPAAEIGDRVGAALDMVKLSGMEKRKPSQLSGGQRQRVALARALVFNPSVLLLDEPLSALDKGLRGQMQIEIKALQRRVGITTICVTHDQGEALSMSDRVAVFSAGVMQQLAQPHDLYFRPATPFVAAFVGETNRWAGVVASSSDGALSLMLGGDGTGPVIVPGAGSFGAGDKVSLYLRPEFIDLVEPSGLAGAIPGRVTGISFQGAFTDLIVEAGDLGPVMVRSTVVLGDLDIGRAVAIRPRWETGAVFPA